MMESSTTIQPLRYPEPWPEPSPWEEKSKRLPLIGWQVSALISVSRLRSIEYELERQFATRDPQPPDYWQDETRRQNAEMIIDACIEAIAWPHRHFIPNDNFGVMISIRTGDLCEMDAMFRIEKGLGRRLRNEEWRHLVDLSLGEVVEYLSKQQLAAEGPAMIDRHQRDQLAQELRKLVTGKLSNDDFDDSYYDKYCGSSDPAVREVARFGWCLYSSDVLWPYYLKGRHKVNAETMRRATHSVLFLQSDLEYAYPVYQEDAGGSAIGMLGCGAMILSLTGLVMAGMMLPGRDYALIGWLVFGSVVAAVVWRLMSWLTHVETQQLHAELEAVGDTKVWPFTSRQEMAATRGSGFVECVFGGQA